MPAPALAVAALPAAITALGGLFQGWAQGKISQQQLEMERQRLGLSREQFEFMKQQALRQNKIQDANTQKISPLLMQMMARSQENTAMRPNPVRLTPPNVNNPYQPGVGNFGNQAPPPSPAMPWLNNQPAATTDPRLLAQRLLGR